ncbi:MAG: hypothetical protein JEZ08_16325 [Clostridiales bacterium]|nr:hypothetical protein [Clostridiales bacterium]
MKKQWSIIFVIAIIVGGVFLSDRLGLWETESTKIPAKTQTGEFDPGDIRGSYTFGDIENSFEIPAEKLAIAFGIETDIPETFQIKNLEAIYVSLPDNTEIGTGSVRYFVSLYTDIESTLAEPTWLPTPAIELLIAEGMITDTDEALNWKLDLTETTSIISEVTDKEEHPEPAVKGSTTIQDLINQGLSFEDIESVLKTTEFTKVALVRDVCTANGLKFSEIKIELENLINNQ